MRKFKPVEIKFERPRHRVTSGNIDQAPKVEETHQVSHNCHLCDTPCEGVQMGNGRLRLRCPVHDIVCLEYAPPVFTVEPLTPEEESAGASALALEAAPGLSKGQKMAIAAGAVAAAGAAAAQFFSG